MDLSSLLGSVRTAEPVPKVNDFHGDTAPALVRERASTWVKPEAGTASDGPVAEPPAKVNGDLAAVLTLQSMSAPAELVNVHAVLDAGEFSYHWPSAKSVHATAGTAGVVVSTVNVRQADQDPTTPYKSVAFDRAT
ncbi:hypothetical protein [Aeromicrobium sp.]|uniref:hypothetical protein n=1 Tax=Aeromicrobium sp. TaxID=1871063 RepID=UPI0025C51451|nr:hypothetical protein [Aeromicrobium sp.]